MTPRRRRPSEEALIVLRDVIEEPYRKRGCRVFISVDSKGEVVGERLVPLGRDSKAAEADLWAELDEIDPILPHLSPPVLRLVK